jgi:hypothetical protein
MQTSLQSRFSRIQRTKSPTIDSARQASAQLLQTWLQVIRASMAAAVSSISPAVGRGWLAIISRISGMITSVVVLAPVQVEAVDAIGNGIYQCIARSPRHNGVLP